MKDINKSVWGWAFYDWANSAFSTTVMAGFFPLFFKSYFSAGTEATISTAKLGLGNALGTLLVVITGPILGTIADIGASRKKFLFLFAVVGSIFTALLALPEKGNWPIAVLFYVVASLAHGSSFAFYDALLIDVSQKKNVHFISSFGYALGYLGGGILFAINVLMFQFPGYFGLSSGEQAVKASFISVAVWWFLFSLPILLWTQEKPQTQPKPPFGQQVSQAFATLRKTLKNISNIKPVLLFLGAYFLYNDGVGTTIKMAVDYGLSLGFQPGHLIMALLIVQVVGVPFSLFFGKLAGLIRPQRAILISIGVYIVITFWGVFMDTIWEFFVMAGAIGCVQGGIQSVSRSFFSSLIPQDKSAEFFGFYNLLGRFSGILGPLLMGAFGLAFQNPRAGVVSLTLLFICGAILLLKINPKETSA